MVVEAFVYMYFVGLGTTLGVATVVFIGFKYYQKTKTKTNKKARF